MLLVATKAVMVKDGVIGHRPGFGHHEDLWASAPPFCTGETQASEAKIKVGSPSPDRLPMLPSDGCVSKIATECPCLRFRI